MKRAYLNQVWSKLFTNAAFKEGDKIKTASYKNTNDDQGIV